MKRLKGYRTILLNVAAIGTLLVTEYAELVPPKILPWAFFGLASINIILRTKTDTPVGKRK